MAAAASIHRAEDLWSGSRTATADAHLACDVPSDARPDLRGQPLERAPQQAVDRGLVHRLRQQQRRQAESGAWPERGVVLGEVVARRLVEQLRNRRDSSSTQLVSTACEQRSIMQHEAPRRFAGELLPAGVSATNAAIG